MLFPIPPLLIKFLISANFEAKKIRQKSPLWPKFFCLKIGWNWKFDQQRGYGEQHLFYEIFLFIFEIFDFIIVLDQKYQFFCKSPTGATALDFMDPIFLIYMTSAFQRYATLFWGIFFELGSMPIKMCRVTLAIFW